MGKCLKTKDLVLVRNSKQDKWILGVYQNVPSINYYIYNVQTDSFSYWKECIPFGGNENLLGKK